jgi:biofilm PGA synthesis N-glycosyltransferase PgaC
MTYVLMTAAHNEEAFIEGTIRSVLSQTLLPKRWVIVSDNSHDRTDKIVESYARQHEFMRLVRVVRAPGRDFSSKVIALHRGSKLLEGVEYQFIGNIDADLSLEPQYFEGLINHFRNYPSVGLAGGFVYEESGGEYRSLRRNDVRDVGHAAQLVRRKCYEAIGGYAVLKYGGEDWYAQTKARMLGWEVQALPSLRIYHHRCTGGSSASLKNSFRLGKQDYSFGSDPIFEIVKCLRRVTDRPYLGVAFARLAGFMWSYVVTEPRAVPDDLISFLRQEQRDRISFVLRRGRVGRNALVPTRPCDAAER